jgi:acyl-CoA reductase-like NAD-dependent aldehyde dehydrogenase
MADLFRNFIDGKWVDSESGETYERQNPATGELVATYVSSNAKDVQAAVDAATKAFKSWRLVPAPKRGEILYRVGQIMLDRKEAFAREMTEEMGKVINEARRRSGSDRHGVLHGRRGASAIRPDHAQ